VGGGRYKESELRVIQRIYFVFIYENRRVKPVEIVLKNRGGGRMMEEVNLIKIYSKHICKCHNLFPCTTIIC
jgi:hypothetical protein